MTESTGGIGGLEALQDAAGIEAPEMNPENVRQPREPKNADRHGWWWATGRRKSAVARVRLRPANEGGSLRVQKTAKKFKEIPEYFSEIQDRMDALAPLAVTGLDDKLEIIVRVHGGGHTAQAQAIRLGLARALRDYDPNTEDALREAGYLTVDSRKVERKKYGQPGARRRFQFSKR